ncbi:MAG: aminotransferase class I/II-fold pyridoxal phosphate-dependent enzyme [Gemmatimonadota bacterium]
MAVLASRIANLGTENAFEVGKDIARLEAQGKRIIKFNLGQPDFRAPEHLDRELIRQLEAGNSGYVDPAGILPLRRAIADHMRKTRGVDVDPSRVVVTAGAKPPIGLTVLTYVDQGDEVIYPSPGFPIYESWVRFLGAVPVPLRLREERDFAFTPEELGDLITPRTKLVILNSPSNPTGGVLSKDDLEGIARVIREKGSPDLRLYSDEIYEQILFDGEEHRSLVSEEGMQERTVVASGHSKGFGMTGWRLGWAVLPNAEEASVFSRFNVNTISCVPPFIQEAGREAYENPETEKYVARNVRAFQERRDRVVPGLNEIPGITCRTPKGTFYVFPNVEGYCKDMGIMDAYERLPEEERASTSPSTLLQHFLLYRYGIATLARRSFCKLGSEGEHYLRLSIANSMEELEAGVARMAEAAGDREGFLAFMEEAPHRK